MLPYSFFAPLTRLKTREINASDDFVGSTLVVVVFFSVLPFSLCVPLPRGFVFVVVLVRTERTDAMAYVRYVVVVVVAVFQFPPSLARGVKRVLQTK